MERLQEIDTRIQDLTEELERVEGTPTEIYTRIVGYYRSLKNWNRGKREEYNHRVTFRPNQNTHRDADPDPGRAAAQRVRGQEERASSFTHPRNIEGTPDHASGAPIQSYTYFYREHCPNCPPVRSYVEQLPIRGTMVDVDTGNGMQEAINHQILSTPTVILMDSRGYEVAQAGSVEQLRTILESAG